MARTTIRTEDITASEVTTAKMAVDPTNASNLSSGSVPTAQLGNVDTAGLEDDIALLGFKVASNGSLAKYNLVDQTVDDFQDSSGIDASASTNEVRDASGKYVSGLIPGNYFGDDSLGSCQFGASGITQTGHSNSINNVLATGTSGGGPGNSSYGNATGQRGDVPNDTACYEGLVLNKSGSYDGDMWVGNFTDLTIDASVTLTVDQPCRGMLIYVSGDCTINGALSMTCRGGKSDPTISGGSDSAVVNASGLQLGVLTSGGSQTLAANTFAGAGSAAVTAVGNQDAISSNGTVYSILKEGADGGAAGGEGKDSGDAGTTGAAAISTGGGGTGLASSNRAKGGDGGAFSGGASGGSVRGAGSTAGTAGGDYGGAGGHGATHSGNAEQIMAGAGNPPGDGVAGGNGGTEGVGGIIWLLVGGDLTIGSGATVQCDGADGQQTGSGTRYPGSGSGAGALQVLYAGTLSNSGTFRAEGGLLGVGSPSSLQAGSGGDGGVNSAQISDAGSAADLTLVSTSTTAEATPTKGDMVMTYTNQVGTATLNTDLKGYVSRDNGTTYTAGTLASQGTSGGHTIVTFHDLDISSQPSGTTMRYKLTTHNQGALKETRIQAVSLGWS